MTSFSDLGVDVALEEILASQNIVEPFEVQVEAIPFQACLISPHTMPKIHQRKVPES